MKTNKESGVTKFISFLTLSLFFLFSRCLNLNSLPVFADEAIYIRWSQIIKNVETLRFIPLTDGKQPLFMWLVVPLLSIFKDPLISGRLISIFAGFVNYIFIFLITAILFYQPKKLQSDPIIHIFQAIDNHFYISLIAAFIYLLLPFTFFFDRLATPDNLLSAFVTIATFLVILQTHYYRFDISILTGVCLGLAYLTKSPAIYFITISSIYLLIRAICSQPKHNLIIKIFFSLLPLVISFSFYFLLKLGPQFHMISLRNKDYIWPISEILKHPLDPFKPHLSAFITLFSSYVSLPIILLFLLSCYFFLKKLKNNHTIDPNIVYVFFSFLAPLVATLTFTKVFTGRYVLFCIPFFVILLSYFLQSLPFTKISNRLVIIFTFLLLFCPNIIYVNKILFDPFHLKIPQTESGYLNDWTSGWGVKDISAFLKQRSKISNVIVGTEGFFGSLPDGLQIYTDSTPKLTVIGLGVNLTSIPNNLIDAFNHNDEVYLLINPHRQKLTDSELSKLKTIQSYTRPDNTTLVLYQLKSI